MCCLQGFIFIVISTVFQIHQSNSLDNFVIFPSSQSASDLTTISLPSSTLQNIGITVNGTLVSTCTSLSTSTAIATPSKVRKRKAEGGDKPSRKKSDGEAPKVQKKPRVAPTPQNTIEVFIHMCIMNPYLYKTKM